MRVAILGAGALGTLFGGLLADCGETVWLVHHRPEYVSAMDGEVHVDLQNGQTITASVEATTDVEAIDPIDLAILLVKTPQTEAAIEDHAACIGPETRVLTLQNGLDNYDYLRETLGDARALGGVTYQGAELQSPGSVTQTNAGDTTFGGADYAFAERVATMFRSSGISPVEVISDPRPAIWDKQLVSLAFKPVAALTRLRNGDLVEQDALLRVMEGVVDEAQAVAAARGIDVSAEETLDMAIEIACDNPNHRSSMLQDVRAGRETEISAINWKIVEYARQENINVPYNETLTALVRGLERSYLDT